MYLYLIFDHVQDTLCESMHMPSEIGPKHDDLDGGRGGGRRGDLVLRRGKVNIVRVRRLDFHLDDFLMIGRFLYDSIDVNELCLHACRGE